MSDQLHLCRITPENSDGLREMALEFRTAGEDVFDLALDDPDTFFRQVARFEAGKQLPAGFVRSSEFWLRRGTTLLGRSSLRHTLTPTLELDSGHIGYEIRPSARRQGHGSVLLKLTLREARAIGLARVLLTTEPTNTASIKIIQNNGGAFLDNSVSPKTGRVKNRYWIALARAAA